MPSCGEGPNKNQREEEGPKKSQSCWWLTGWVGALLVCWLGGGLVAVVSGLLTVWVVVVDCYY